MLATAYWAYDAKLMAEMARALGRADRAEHYERLRAGIVAAFNHAYVGDDAYIEGDTQTVYLLALHMDLIPAELRARAAERLVENIERHDFHLTTGFVGVGLLCPTLSEMGYSDVAHRLLRNETFPSWGYSIRHGATTIWERWDGWTDTDGFQTPMMNSFNHYSLGSVGQWLYEYVGGIRAAAPGYERVLIAPEPGELEPGRASIYRSVRGTIIERVAARGRRAPPRGRDPAQRHRHRRRPGRGDRGGRVGSPRLHGGGEPDHVLVTTPCSRSLVSAQTVIAPRHSTVCPGDQREPVEGPAAVVLLLVLQPVEVRLDLRVGEQRAAARARPLATGAAA